MKPTVWFLPMLLLGTAAYAAPPLWQQNRTYEALSNTAMSITGSVGFKGSTLILDGKKAIPLESVGVSKAAWDMGGAMEQAAVFRLGSDLGVLLNGNTICSGPARYVVFYEDDTYGATLNALFFESKKPPKDANSPGLCGTFSYIAD